MTGAEAAARIGAALEQMTSALALEQLGAADKISGELAALCAEATAGGVQLDPAQREVITHLYRRCGEAAERRGQALQALLLQSGQSRRASETYRSR